MHDHVLAEWEKICALPGRGGDKNKLSLVTQIVPPHLLMGYICKHQEQFERCLGAQATHVHKFWVGLYESHDGHKLFMEHAQLIGKAPDDLVHVLPLVIHEDAGPYARDQILC